MNSIIQGAIKLLLLLLLFVCCCIDFAIFCHFHILLVAFVILWWIHAFALRFLGPISIVVKHVTVRT